MADFPQQRTRLSEWIVAGASALSALGILTAAALWLTGTWAGPIKSPLEVLGHQVDALQARIDALPRADQLAGVDAHTHALDGRMDALENRIRGVEIDNAGTVRRVQSIEESSRVSLQGRR
jgi:hypothetical protein